MISHDKLRCMMIGDYEICPVICHDKLRSVMIGYDEVHQVINHDKLRCMMIGSVKLQLAFTVLCYLFLSSLKKFHYIQLTYLYK